MKCAFAAVLVVASIAQAAYWMQDLHHQGIAPFNSQVGYQVFRNVKEWGAKGDGGTMCAIFILRLLLTEVSSSDRRHGGNQCRHQQRPLWRP